MLENPAWEKDRVNPAHIHHQLRVRVEVRHGEESDDQWTYLRLEPLKHLDPDLERLVKAAQLCLGAGVRVRLEREGGDFGAEPRNLLLARCMNQSAKHDCTRTDDDVRRRLDVLRELEQSRASILNFSAREDLGWPLMLTDSRRHRVDVRPRPPQVADSTLSVGHYLNRALHKSHEWRLFKWAASYSALSGSPEP